MPRPIVTSVTNLSDPESPKPVIVEFENATPQEEDVDISSITDPKTKARTLTLAYHGDHDTTYSGVVGVGYPTDLTRTYLAIHNKTNNTIRFVEVEQCRLKSTHHEKQEHEPETRAIDTRSLLYKNFGSKSAARAIDRKEKTAYKSDMVKERMDQSLSVAKNVAEQQPIDEFSDVAPPYNKDTTKVSEAYSLELVLPEDVLQALIGPALTLIETKITNLP